jgi:hypothetical protein
LSEINWPRRLSYQAAERSCSTLPETGKTPEENTFSITEDGDVYRRDPHDWILLGRLACVMNDPSIIGQQVRRWWKSLVENDLPLPVLVLQNLDCRGPKIPCSEAMVIDVIGNNGVAATGLYAVGPQAERLFETHPAPGAYPCWCMHNHRSGVDKKSTPRAIWINRNHRDKKALVEQGRSHGILVYSFGEPVSWCRYGLMKELPRIDNNPKYRKLASASGRTLWRITCFVVHKKYRRRGWHVLL